MIQTSSKTTDTISLGKNLDDGSEVSLSPNKGPLLIFGDSGSGTTFTLKKIFSRLTTLYEASYKETSEAPENDLAPPLLLDPAVTARYGHLARFLGAERLIVDTNDTASPWTGPPEGPLVLSADLRQPAAEWNLRQLLLRQINGNSQIYHLLADDLDHPLISHELAFAFLWSAFKHGAARGILGAAVVRDPDALISNPEGKILLSVARRILIMKTSRPGTLPNPVRQAMKASDVETEHVKNLGQGEGVLLHKTKREPTPGPVVVRIEATDDEHRVFNTDPEQERPLYP